MTKVKYDIEELFKMIEVRTLDIILQCTNKQEYVLTEC